IMSMKALLGEI
uniref:Uncharacterized protein n=1 Tax=Strongyloides stercoralis TaxID=6248 RepID=A0A0K0EM50_STRER